MFNSKLSMRFRELAIRDIVSAKRDRGKEEKRCGFAAGVGAECFFVPVEEALLRERDQSCC